MENEVKQTKKKGGALFTLFACIMTGVIVYFAVTIGQELGKNADVNNGNNKVSESNSNSNSNTVQNDKVVKVAFEYSKINDETVNTFINATDASGKTVWKVDLGTAPAGVDGIGINFQGKDFYYYSDSKLMTAYDIQTGKVAWSKDTVLSYKVVDVKENNNKLHVIMADNDSSKGYHVVAININDGSLVKKVDVAKVEDYKFE